MVQRAGIYSGQGQMVTPMTDARVNCEEIFKAQEVNSRMKDKAAHACHALCRARIVEEIKHRKGTATSEHLKVVLRVIDGPPLAKVNNPGRSLA